MAFETSGVCAHFDGHQVYPMGFGKGAAGTNGTGFMLLVILFVELFAVSLGQLFASISPSIQVRGETIVLWGNITDSRLQIAVLFTPFTMVVLSNFCGVTITFPTMAQFFRSWLYQVDPFTRLMSAMLSTELQCEPLIFIYMHKEADIPYVAVWKLCAGLRSSLSLHPQLVRHAISGPATS